MQWVRFYNEGRIKRSIFNHLVVALNVLVKYFHQEVDFLVFVRVLQC